MSDIVVGTIKANGGVVLMINPPTSPDEAVRLSFINKIVKEDETSFFFPATYGRFDCEYGEIISNEVYNRYLEAKREFTPENIFVFEVLPDSIGNDGTYCINSLTEFVNKVIKAQNKVKSINISAEFEALIQSPFYNEFLDSYGFTSSEILILKGLFKYAFLTGSSIESLIRETAENVGDKANKKLLRKEFINVLRQRLS